jgi:hypothetical protein
MAPHILTVKIRWKQHVKVTPQDCVRHKNVEVLEEMGLPLQRIEPLPLSPSRSLVTALSVLCLYCCCC